MILIEVEDMILDWIVYMSNRTFGFNCYLANILVYYWLLDVREIIGPAVVTLAVRNHTHMYPSCESKVEVQHRLVSTFKQYVVLG